MAAQAAVAIIILPPMSVQQTYVGTGVGDALRRSFGTDYVGIFHTDGTKAGEHEFRLYGDYIALFEDVARARCKHRLLVHFYAYAVPDKADRKSVV